MLLRRAAIVIAAPLLVLAASCEHRHDDFASCDFVARRCRTVCDSWCDGWGCYPDCWDDCWDECGYYPSRTPAPLADAATPDASDASTPSGSGVLCSPCSTNDECGAGSLCIVRGGASSSDASTEASVTDASVTDASAPGDAGTKATGFCGSACQSPNDCPQGFACVAIGATRQCLPTTANCQ